MTVIIIALTTEMVPADAMVAHGFASMVAVQPVTAAVTAGVACTGVSATHTAAVASAVSATVSTAIATTISTTAVTTTVLRIRGPHDRQAIRE